MPLFKQAQLCSCAAGGWECKAFACRFSNTPCLGCIVPDVRDASVQVIPRPGAGASDAASQDPSDWLPAWFPASYDLATEVHFFLKDYHQACPLHEL